MSNFVCKVMTPQGQIIKVKVDEKDKISCLKKLKRNGMIPISVENSFKLLKSNEKNKKSTATIYSRKKKKVNKDEDIISGSSKITIDHLKEFTEDFYLLKKLNFTNKEALKAIISKTKNTHMKDCLQNILLKVEENDYIYKAMKQYTDIFPFVYINLIKNGELNGELEESLKYAIKYLDDEQNIKVKIRGELIPNIVAFIGILILLMLAILVGIPNLQNVFASYGNIVYLPQFVLFIINCVSLIVKFWYVILFVLIVGIAIFVKFKRTDKGRYKVDSFKYNCILIGKTLYLLDFSRVIRSIILNLQNKMRTQDALEISKNVTKNTYMLNLIEKSINNVYLGKDWLEVFEKEKFINPIFLELLKKGCKTKSNEILQSVIEYIDKEIEKEIDKILKILPQISYCIVGITLLLFVVVVLIPCMQVYLGGLLFL